MLRPVVKRWGRRNALIGLIFLELLNIEMLMVPRKGLEIFRFFNRLVQVENSLVSRIIPSVLDLFFPPMQPIHRGGWSPFLRGRAAVQRSVIVLNTFQPGHIHRACETTLKTHDPWKRLTVTLVNTSGAKEMRVAYHNCVEHARRLTIVDDDRVATRELNRLRSNSGNE